MHVLDFIFGLMLGIICGLSSVAFMIQYGRHKYKN